MTGRETETWSLGESYAYCERLTRRAASNFYPAFLLLPRDQRRAMCALYAYMRVTDDLGDAPGSADSKQLPLEQWREDLRAALGSGVYAHPLHPALHDTVVRYGIAPTHLEEVLDGVVMDLVMERERGNYATFADLYGYCYRVASAVGLACIPIWGCKEPQARKPAEAAGIALQLTNILRDVREDASRGRIYLPLEDLATFGYAPEEIYRGVYDVRFRALMQFQADRARDYYEAADPLIEMLPSAGRAVFLVMLRTYRALLEALIRSRFDVFSRRVRVHPLHKLWLAARALPVCWGLSKQ